MHKRKKQIYRYYLTRWKQHKNFSFGMREIRISDFKKLLKIIKRGGYSAWLKQPHTEKKLES